MKPIPMMTMVYVVGRITSWLGYLKHPLYGSFGNATPLLSNVGMLVYGIYCVLLG